MSFSQFNAIGIERTEKKFLDFGRPQSMVDADKVFDKLAAKHGNNLTGYFIIVDSVSSIITPLKRSEISGVWPSLEKSLNNKKSLDITATDSIGELSTAMGLFYSALVEIDKSNNTEAIRSFSSTYNSARFSLEQRFLSNLTGSDKLRLQRVMTITDSFLDRVTTRYNKNIEEGKIPGPAL